MIKHRSFSYLCIGENHGTVLVYTNRSISIKKNDLYIIAKEFIFNLPERPFLTIDHSKSCIKSHVRKAFIFFIQSRR